MEQKELRDLFGKLQCNFPNEFLSDDEKWMDKCQKIRQMWSEKKSEKEIKKEIGQWLHDQKINYKNKTKAMSKPELREEFEKLMKDFPEHFLTDEEKWQVNFAEVQEWMRQNTNRPPRHTGLGKWLQKQLEYYKETKHKFLKEHYHKQFTDFMLKHPKQFSTYLN